MTEFWRRRRGSLSREPAGFLARETKTAGVAGCGCRETAVLRVMQCMNCLIASLQREEHFDSSWTLKLLYKTNVRITKQLKSLNRMSSRLLSHRKAGKVTSKNSISAEALVSEAWNSAGMTQQSPASIRCCSPCSRVTSPWRTNRKRNSPL